MSRVCNWDCSCTGHVNIGKPITLCSWTYCTAPDHPKRGPLPKCKTWPPREGAITKWGAPCSLKTGDVVEQEALF